MRAFEIYWDCRHVERVAIEQLRELHAQQCDQHGTLFPLDETQWMFTSPAGTFALGTETASDK